MQEEDSLPDCKRPLPTTHIVLTSNLAPALHGVGRGTATAKASNSGVQEIHRSWAGILKRCWGKNPESQRFRELRVPHTWPRAAREPTWEGLTLPKGVKQRDCVGHANPSRALAQGLGSPGVTLEMAQLAYPHFHINVEGREHEGYSWLPFSQLYMWE